MKNTPLDVKQKNVRGAGFASAVHAAPSPMMRAIAEIAVAEGLSYGDIARAWKPLTTPAAILGHLAAANPHPDTVKQYARILRLDDEMLAVLPESGRLPERRWPIWKQRLGGLLDEYDDRFAPDAVSRVRDYLDRLEGAALGAALTTFVRLCARDARHLKNPSFDMFPVEVKLLPALDEILPRHLKLRPHLLQVAPVEPFLAALKQALGGGPLDEYEATTVLQVALSLIRAKGGKVAPYLRGIEQSKPPQNLAKALSDHFKTQPGKK